MVTVTDTGIGVPPEDQERIFESFQQGRRGAPKEEGTGLGLTLSRRIVGLFGGRMWLESTPGVGSTFGFSIPGLPEQADEVACRGRGELPVVVLVDDDRASLDLLSAYLDGSPTQVLRARDGVEALELVRRVLPAAVVLDIKLPRLDGWQVLAELKADPATAAIPVVIASVVDDRPRGLALGADVYLLKPVRRDDLVDALRRVGALRRSALGVVVTSRRILVVEDNPLNLKLVRDVLQFAGYDVIEAQSGEEGLRVAQEDPPDLVLMDLQLPGIDGTETLRRLRQGSLGRDVPVVAVTAFAMAEDRERAALAGFDGYVEKPISVRALPGQIEAFLDGADGPVMDTPVTVLAVDDQPANLRLLDAVLTPRGHRVLTASSGAEALALLETEDIDLVLLDIVMPEMDGHEVCRRIRSTPLTEFLPVVMITASGSEQRLAALESGADDFITKPFDQSELLARVASLARIKRYHDTIRRQADELTEWNTELETRVDRQVAELERTNRLRHFLSPQLADLVVGDESLLQSHRREIVVVFTDLRNFTPFAETSEPEEVMGVLGEYHRAIGALVHAYEGTLERFTGDGIMVFFNDPIPCDDAAERAVRMALDIRDAVSELAARWRRNGHDLALGIGIAQGFATLGRIGFEGRFDYAAIGSVTNLAARLCSDAGPWQVLVTDRVLAATEHISVSEMVGDMQPKGFSRLCESTTSARSTTGR